ncbi:MAG: hypothetical protein FWD35_06090 [Oscillospiraceae bacterium]|nr:hypothetical protein [Oscillospiraceae bacterium]
MIFTGATLNLNTHGARIGSYVRAEVVHTNYGVLYTQPFGVRRSGEDFSIYDLQRAVSTADTAILVNAGSGTRAVDLSANPKRVSVSSRAAASDGLDIDISRLQTRAGHSYTFEVTGTLGASAGVGVRFVFRRANNGGNIVAPAVTGAGGAFSFSYTVSHETIRAQLTANADERYRVRSESDLGNIVITGLVIKEISGDGTTPATPASTSAAPPTVPTVPTTSTVPTTASTISGEPTTASTISGEPTTASTISGEPTTVTTGATFQPTTALTPPTGSEPPIINITPIVRRTVTEICVVCSVEKAWRVVTLYENDIVITQHKAVTKRDAQGNLRGGCLQAS